MHALDIAALRARQLFGKGLEPLLQDTRQTGRN
jgi:hypothetical protein